MKYTNVSKQLPRLIKDLTDNTITRDPFMRAYIGEAISHLHLLADLIVEINRLEQAQPTSNVRNMRSNDEAVIAAIRTDSRCTDGDWVANEVVDEYLKYRRNHPAGAWFEHMEDAFHATAHK